MRPKRYTEIFDFRGYSYDHAMYRYPDARRNEFEGLFEGIYRDRLNIVLDIPAGGGYLRRFLPERVDILACDSSHGFLADNKSVHSFSLESLSLPENVADFAVSLAATHHIANKQNFFDTVLHTVKPGGRYCIGDVCAGSKINRFLDEFIAQHNGTGHEAVYLDLHSGESICKNGSATLYRNEVMPCEWIFPNRQEMVIFCRMLFHLIEITDEQILHALFEHVGFNEKAGRCCLLW